MTDNKSFDGNKSEARPKRSSGPRSDGPRGERPRGERPRSEGPRREGGSDSRAGSGGRSFDRSSKPGGSKPGGFRKDGPPGSGPRSSGPSGSGSRDDKPRGGPRDNRSGDRRGGSDFTGPQFTKGKSTSARGVTLNLLVEVVRNKLTLDEAISDSHFFSRLAERDRRFARQLSTTVLRRFGQLNRELVGYLETPLPPKLLSIKLILLMGMAEHFFMRSPSHALVSENVALARDDHNMRNHHGLVNAILRRVSDRPSHDICSPRFNIPKWMAARWNLAYGDAWLEELSKTMIQTPGLDLAVKPGAEGPDGEHQVMPNGALRYPTGLGTIENLPGFEEGNWWVQDAAAQMPVQMMGDVSGKRVLDLCAAPGGKTMQLAALGAQVTALDISENRLERVKQNLERCKLEAEVVVCDALEYEPSEKFDAILLDAPCSATGTLRRHPELFGQRKEDTLLHNRRLQAKLLGKAVKWLKPGGILVYAVCSLEPEEGIEQVKAGLKALPIELDTAILDSGSDSGDTTPDWLSALWTTPGMLQTYPQTWAEMGGLDGFFAARLRRT